MIARLFVNYEETASVILFCIGFSTMLLHKNLVKKIIGMDIMDTAAISSRLPRATSRAAWRPSWSMACSL